MDTGFYASLLRTSLTTAQTKFKSLMVLEQRLSALETAVNSLSHNKSLIVQNIVDASLSRVTSSLFRVKDFQHVLDFGAQEHLFSSLSYLNTIQS